MQTTVAVVAAFLVGAGPVVTHTEPPGASSPLVPAQAAAADVAVKDNQFEPREVKVKPGATVTWSQTGVNPHSVTAEDGSFDSHPNCTPACMRAGESYSRTFDKAGRFTYRCKIHGGSMSGVVVVEQAATAASAPAPGQEVRPAAANTSADASPLAAVAAQQAGAGSPLARTGGGPSAAAGAAMILAGLACRRIVKR